MMVNLEALKAEMKDYGMPVADRAFVTDLIARHLGAGPAAADRAALVERMRVAIDEQIEYGYTAIALDFATVVMEVVEAAGWGPRAEPVAGTGETLYQKCPNPLCDKGWIRDGGSEVLDKCGEEPPYPVAKYDIVCDTCDAESYVSVDPPEPLSAEEVEAMAAIALPVAFSDDARSVLVRAVLAALPARHAVTVEGA